jgi:hypothetical protein
MDRSSTFVTGVVARASNGSPEIKANSFWRSSNNSPGSIYPDTWQARFDVPSNAILGSVYRFYWSIRKTDGITGEYVGGEFIVG